MQRVPHMYVWLTMWMLVAVPRVLDLGRLLKHRMNRRRARTAVSPLVVMLYLLMIQTLNVVLCQARGALGLCRLVCNDPFKRGATAVAATAAA